MKSSINVSRPYAITPHKECKDRTKEDHPIGEALNIIWETNFHYHWFFRRPGMTVEQMRAFKRSNAADEMDYDIGDIGED